MAVGAQQQGIVLTEYERRIFGLLRHYGIHTQRRLDGVWKKMETPLLDGHDIKRVLQIPKCPLVGEWVQRVLKWQLAHPNGTKEECGECG